MRTLGDRAEVEIHDLSPCEGLGVLERYFSRHLFLAIASAGEGGAVDVWQEPWNQTKPRFSPVPPITIATSRRRHH